MSLASETAALTSYEDFLAAHNRRVAQRFVPGDLVRLAEDVGTKRERTFVFCVTDTKPVNGRIDYKIQPVQGGSITIAQAVHLEPASDRDKAVAAATPVAKFTPCVGQVVTASRLAGQAPDVLMVVLAVNRDATVKLARLGGDDGRYFPKVDIANLTLAAVPTL